MKKFIGKVISAKSEKTVVVQVDRIWQHPIYKKRVKRSKNYHVHDELGVKEGDKVEIIESRPISKLKRWQVVKVIKK
jgi:small subunit ribosomal protein S17